MIFGKPEATSTVLEQAPTPLKSEEEAEAAIAADDELQRLQVASVN
jgi:hypothetical protein